jgi:chromosome segregation ATPase
MEDEQIIKEEAKFLIAKTKKMMENMNLNSMQNQQDKKYQRTNKSNPKINNKSYLTNNISNPSFDSSNLSPSRRSNALVYDNYIINSNSINSISDMKINIKNMTKKISELTNTIQKLEKEIKTKDDIINTLEKKLYSNSEIIDNLNKKIINERSDNSQVENSNMKRKIADLEKKIKDNTFMYEEIIKEYKNKLKGLNDEHDGNITQLNKLSEDFKKLMYNHNGVNHQLEEKKNTVQEFKRKIDEQEINEKLYSQKIEKLEDILRVLLQLIKNLFNEENDFYQKRNAIFEQLKYLTQK